MNKIKLSPGLASVILITAFFAGGGNLLLITLLMFIFCEIDSNIKNNATRIITFSLALTIVSIGWGLLYSGADLLVDCFGKIETTINTFRNVGEYIKLTKFIVPIREALDVVDSLISILLTLAKFGFVISMLTNKPGNNNFISRKVNEYINIILNYINSIENPVMPNVNTNIPVQPQQPQNQPQAPTMSNQNISNSPTN